MAINKVEFDGQTLIDLTGDTVTQQDVLNGKSFHTPDGVQRSGTATIPVSDVTVDGTSVVTNGVAEVVTDNLAPTVTEASSRTNLAVGDSLKTIISKIKKFFSDLKTVAFTGSYNDLSDKPTIPAAQVNSDWNSSSGVSKILNKPSLATVATSGSYNDLSNKPTIPDISTKVSKSGDTMSGNLGLPWGRSDIDGSAPISGGMANSIALTSLSDYKTILGSAVMTDDSNQWNNIISTRHRNGQGDGNKYGMYLRSRLTQESNLVWRQHVNGTWKNEKTIIDSSNIGSQSVNYATSAGDSAKLNGYASDTAASANTIVRRDANKYIYGSYYNSNISNENINSYTNDPAIMFTSNDKWIRRTNLSNLKTWLGSFPASDVYSWAKASTKPSYSWSEIGSRPTKVSQFTNDSGYITSSGSCASATKFNGISVKAYSSNSSTSINVSFTGTNLGNGFINVVGDGNGTAINFTIAIHNNNIGSVNGYYGVNPSPTRSTGSYSTINIKLAQWSNVWIFTNFTFY